MAVSVFLLLFFVTQVSAGINITHSLIERQSAVELIAFVGVPLIATYLGSQELENLQPKPDPSAYPDIRQQYLNNLEEWLSAEPKTVSGRGKTCSSGQRGTQTRTTSRIKSSGRLSFLGETSSSMMAPGGDDPRKPPTPPPKRLPSPYIGDRPRKRTKVGKNKVIYLIDVEEQPLEVKEEQPLEVEVVTLDDEVITIDEHEVFIPVASGSNLVLVHTDTCPDPARPTSTASSEDVLLCEKQSSASESSNGPEEIQFMTDVPRLRPFPGTDLYPRGTTIPITPYWRGLIWGTSSSKVTNTCVMDSFFSHLIYLGRRFPRYFRIHLNAERNEPELFISYLTQHTEGQSRYSLSQCVHLGWNRVVPGGTFPVNNGVVNMVGSQYEAVFSHLRNSDRIWLVHQCECDLPTRVDIRRDRRTWTSAQVQALSAPAEDTHTPEENSKKGNKKCKECKGRFRYLRALVSQATWFHAFHVPRTVNSRDGYPLTIEMQEIGTNAIVHFDLGYFSYVTRSTTGGVSHHTSVHLIADQGMFYYDGMSGSGDLRPIPANLEAMSTLDAVVYFRRYDGGRPRK